MCGTGVASLTGDAEVIRVIGAVVLPGPDMLDMEGDKRLGSLG